MRSFAASSVLVSTLFAATLAGCSSPQRVATPVEMADKVTRAVYANDFAATVANFDDATRKAITRAEVGEMSDKMHSLGDLQSLSERSAAPDTGKYEYAAAFTNGQLLVRLRLDPDGRIGAYRIVPGGAPAGAPASAQK